MMSQEFKKTAELWLVLSYGIKTITIARKSTNVECFMPTYWTDFSGVLSFLLVQGKNSKIFVGQKIKQKTCLKKNKVKKQC